MPRSASLLSRAGGALTGNGWQVCMLGGLEARNGDAVLRHFPGRPVALLLARLAMSPHRSHAREELIELLWPGVAIETGRSRLRTTLSTLRHLLEPPGSGQAVIVADRQTLRLRPGSVSCDVPEFEVAWRSGDLALAGVLYRGELLPGYFDDWVIDERMRLAALHERLLERCDQTPGGAKVAIGAARPSAPQLPPRGLPGYLSSFLGRQDEVAALASAVKAQRLVTLTGAGGAGKTRLAVEVAHLLARAQGDADTPPPFDGVAFVALAECRDGLELADRVRAAVGLPRSEQAPLDELAAALAGRRLVLVLDNYEQLVEADGVTALAELLQALPLAHVLVTSRRVLRLAGECEMALPPLALPGSGDGLVQAAGNAAVSLFVARARDVRADFGLNDANRAEVLEVCRLLEGLPLALEIAASRIRTYSPRQMVEGLSSRFALLVRTGHRALRDPRHASLHAAIAWSWQLLDAAQQDFLGALAVFRGGCSAAEAAAVTAVADVHPRLDALIADSLLMLQPDDGPAGPRFTMLESVREFVVGQLTPHRAAAWRRAHRACFLGRALALAERQQPVPQGEFDNFVQALESALADQQPALALSLALALRQHWEWAGTPPEALVLLRRTADAQPQDTLRLSCLWSLLARLLVQAGQAAAAAQCAERARDSACDTAQRAEALHAQARVMWAWLRDGNAARPLAEQALAAARASAAHAIEAQALLLLGAVTLWHDGLAGEAEPLYAQSAAIDAAHGNPGGALLAEHGRMACLQALGRHEAAIALGQAGLQQAEQLGRDDARILFLNLLALSFEKTRRWALALQACRQEAYLSGQRHRVYNIAYALWNQGHYLARLRQPEEAAMLMAFSQQYWTDRFGPLPRGDERGVARVRRLVAAQIGAAAELRAWARGLALPLHEGLRLGGAAG